MSNIIKNANNTDKDIIVILDESSSMAVMGSEPKDAVNTFMQEQKDKCKKDSSTFTFWTFNHNVSLKIDDQLLETVQPVTEYRPSGMTALNDAVGDAIHTKLLKTKSNGVIVLIISDGEENSSRKYTRKQIDSLINRVKSNKDWKFIFIGCNQDVFKEGEKIGISQTNCLVYTQNTDAEPDKPTLTSLSRDVSVAVANFRSVSHNSQEPQQLDLSGIKQPGTSRGQTCPARNYGGGGRYAPPVTVSRRGMTAISENESPPPFPAPSLKAGIPPPRPPSSDETPNKRHKSN